MELVYHPGGIITGEKWSRLAFAARLIAEETAEICWIFDEQLEFDREEHFSITQLTVV